MKFLHNNCFIYWFFSIFIVLVASCQSAPHPSGESQVNTTADEPPPPPPPSKSGATEDSMKHHKHHTPNRNPASVDTAEEALTAKGYAMVYCPAKMIIHVPSIIDAEVTKAEVSAAYTNFIAKLQGQNPDKNAQAIARDVKGDSIDIYENMRVAIEFDSSDFEQISKNDNALQSFKSRQNLDWEWVVKPLQSTRKSIIIFKFYGKDPTSGEEASILEKTIDIAVQVDARSFFEKWGDFLLDDPKTTIVSILIPVVSFLGGFISAKRKKTASA